MKFEYKRDRYEEFAFGIEPTWRVGIGLGIGLGKWDIWFGFRWPEED